MRKIIRIFSGNYHSVVEILSGFKGESKFSTWMYRVALNTAITLFRKPQKTNAGR
jgi:DNA-directed RNA polymerase specialized sigma24 family protein